MAHIMATRFTMRADILRQTNPNDGSPINQEGEWVFSQDPDSGAIKRIWAPVTVDDPDTAEDDVAQATFPCIARGILQGGIRVTGANQRMSELYEIVDYVSIQFPKRVKVNRRDRITNIRDMKGNIIWSEEDQVSNPPTVFNVNGVVPVLGPFNHHIENSALLERAEIQ